MTHTDTASDDTAQNALTPIPCTVSDLKVYKLEEHSYDDAKMAALFRQSHQEGFDIQGRLDRAWKSGANRFDGPGEALFAAEHEGRIIAICGRSRDPREHGVLQLRHGYVMPEWRDLGVGSALMQKLIDIPPGDFTKVTVRAYFPAVRKFCERNGFLPVEHPRYTHELAMVGG